MTDSDLKKRGYADGNYWNTCPTCGGTYQGDKRAMSCKGCATSAHRIEELEELLAEAETNLTHTFRDMGVRRDKCIADIRAALEEVESE